MKFIQNTPCTLVTGFLGSGKTTLINQLLACKKAEAKWGLLINEFGQIGIDGKLIDASDGNQGLAIREVSGGCICCTSQLPLQIALSRLLAEHTPSRLVIEPTGLAHPKALIEQLSEPHWQTSLSMQLVVCVLNANQWQDIRYQEHDGYQSHVQYADVVLINRYEDMSKPMREQLIDWIIEYNPNAQIVWHSNTADCINRLYAQIQTVSQVIYHEQQKQRQQVRISLNPLLTNTANNTVSVSNNGQFLQSKLEDANATQPTNDTANEVVSLPYRYHDYQQGMSVGGWRLPANWIFDHGSLQQWLSAIPNWQRIKGVVNTDEGWMRFNFTPDSLTTSHCPDQSENQLEIILLETHADKLSDADRARDWQTWDAQLLQMRLFSG